MADERHSALETLRRIRSERYPELSESLLAAIYEIEIAAQYQVDRAPVIAQIRDLMLPREE